jgi:hypothetical protein
MPRKREKAQMNYELKTNGHETTTEKAIGIIPESLKHIDTHPIHETACPTTERRLCENLMAPVGR